MIAAAAGVGVLPDTAYGYLLVAVGAGLFGLVGVFLNGSNGTSAFFKLVLRLV